MSLRRRTPRRATAPLWVCVAVLGACSAPQPDRVALGPLDGRDLPPADTGRVAVGDPAPDFALESYGGPVVRLSQFRDAKNVVLVFYRGHW